MASNNKKQPSLLSSPRAPQDEHEIPMPKLRPNKKSPVTVKSHSEDKDLSFGKRVRRKLNLLEAAYPRAPSLHLNTSPWLQAGERHLCSGICLNIPCLDDYAPNRSSCLCVAPAYDSIRLNDLIDWNVTGLSSYTNTSLLHSSLNPLDLFTSQVLPRLHTGDVVLAQWPLSENEIGTQMSRCMGHSRTSHVGLVYRPSDCPAILKHRDRMFPAEVHASRPLMLHMIAGGEGGCRHEAERGGLDILDLEVYVKDYLDKFSHSNGESVESWGPHAVTFRMLQNCERDEEFYRGIENVVNRYLDTEFEPDMNQWNVVASQIDCCQGTPLGSLWHAREDLETLFCSTLTAEVWKGAGLLDGSSGRLVSREYVPPMWDSTRDIQFWANQNPTNVGFFSRLSKNLVTKKSVDRRKDKTKPISLSTEIEIVGPESARERREKFKYPSFASFGLEEYFFGRTLLDPSLFQ